MNLPWLTVEMNFDLMRTSLTIVMTLLEFLHSIRGHPNGSTNYLSVGNHENILELSPEDASIELDYPPIHMNTSPKALQL